MLANRVSETSTTTGTGAFNLNGAQQGFRTFLSAFGSGSKCVYIIENGSEWEVGYGTISGSTLTRDTVVTSSNSNQLVNFSAGTKRVFNDLTSSFINPNYITNVGNTFNLLVDNTFELTLTNPTNVLAVSNAKVGKKFMVRLIQDSSGNRTVTWWSTIRWSQVPTLSTGANKVDWFGFICTGTNTYDGFVLAQNL
jgi:hypothetical protein